MPIVESERLLNDAAGPRVTSAWLPRNREEEETARRNSEDILRLLRARPGRRPVRLKPRRQGRADVAWNWNLADLVGIGPLILKMLLAGPGAGWVTRRRLGPARPHLRTLARPAKPLDLVFFLRFENITERDIKLDISAFR